MLAPRLSARQTNVGPCPGVLAASLITPRVQRLITPRADWLEGWRAVIISSLVFEDFGPFRERTAIPCAPITLLFGENGAGKSAILNALLLLRQSSVFPPDDDSPLRLSGPDVTYGSDRSLFFGYGAHDTARIGIDFPVREEWEFYEQALTAADVGLSMGQEFGFALSSGDQGPSVVLSSLIQYLGGSREELFELTPESGGEFIANVFPMWRSRPGKHSVGLRKGSLNLRNSALAKDVAHIRELQPLLDTKVRAALSGEQVWWGEPDEVLDLSQYVATAADSAGADFWPIFLSRLQSYDLGALAEDIEEISDGRLMLRAFAPDYEAFKPSRVMKGEAGESPYTQGVVLAQLIEELDYEREAALRSLPKLALASSSRLIRVLGDLVSVGPTRALPSRVMTLQELREGPLASTIGRLVSSAEILGRVNEWGGHLGLGYALKVQRVNVAGVQDSFVLIAHDEKTNVDCTLRDIGYGISQVLPVLTAAIAGSDSLVLIQQPELHLHPRLQARVADVFAAGAKQDNQFLIETHSEHIVYRLQRLIREGLPASDVAINWIYRDEDGSHCYPIRLDDEGDFIDEWPGGFFEDGFDDVIAGADI